MIFNYPIIRSDAEISNCGKHRYSLTRFWDEDKPKICFIGLNPSRADASFNDPTITKCIKFAQRWTERHLQFDTPNELRYGGLYFMNLYSFRSPEPKILKQAISVGDAYQDKTDYKLVEIIDQCISVVCCWGSWNFIEHRSKEVLALIKKRERLMYCLGTNKDGQPKHPLYLKDASELQQYVG